jgi:hypothetical protein
MPNNYFVQWVDTRGIIHSEDVSKTESGIGVSVYLKERHKDFVRIIKMVRYPNLWEISQKAKERFADESLSD